MREITKEITLTLARTPTPFRLTKLDAFSGAHLLRLLSRAPSASVTDFFLALPEPDLRSLMRACLNRAEQRLPAGWTPVMTGDDWTAPDLEHDAWTCLRLTLEVALWTLDGFFPESGQVSPSPSPDT